MNSLNRQPFKGRGAVTNLEGRFEAHQSEPFDDGWGTLEREPPSPRKTQVHLDTIRSIITRNTSPDIPFDYSINPYRGCEHGCIYCYARPSHTYLGHSAGLDFETLLYAKEGAAGVLEAELRKRSYQPKVIMLGSNTDPYQPIERTYQITRSLLETLLRFRHPVALITKGALILRDLDLLAELARQNLTQVTVSITTLDPTLANKLEPRAMAPSRRLEVVQQLTQAGIRVAVNAAPMIPALNDMELEQILTQAQAAGARAANYIFLRLPLEVAGLFQEWLETHFPDRAAHVMSLIRQSSEGKEYNASFGTRFKGSGPYAQLLKQRFQITCRRLGLSPERSELTTALFRCPPRIGDQLELFQS